MILNQAYVADNEEEYSYLVFDYYSQYYKLLETIVSFYGKDKSRRNALFIYNRVLQRRDDF